MLNPIPCWRLQHRADRVVKSHYWSSSACTERSSSGSQRNSQVQPRLDTSAPVRSPLAGYPVQTLHFNHCRQALPVADPAAWNSLPDYSMIRHSTKTLLGDVLLSFLLTYLLQTKHGLSRWRLSKVIVLQTCRHTGRHYRAASIIKQVRHTLLLTVERV